jgi:hypothetical protein
MTNNYDKIFIAGTQQMTPILAQLRFITLTLLVSDSTFKEPVAATNEMFLE